MMNCRTLETSEREAEVDKIIVSHESFRASAETGLEKSDDLMLTGLLDILQLRLETSLLSSPRSVQRSNWL
jgi:hypothetical protein